ncbi:MAG: hypothetical protein ABJC74_03470, partial [Gemmatimonadota bacterium]
VIQGPVHSNDTIQIASTGATFKGQVTTAAPTIVGQGNGTFTLPPQKSVTRIPMPTVADLAKLDTLANLGSTKFTGTSAGSTGQAITRIVFDTATLNGQVEGFFKIYQGNPATTWAANFVSARLPELNVPMNSMGTAGHYMEVSPNCGDYTVSGTDTVFLSFRDHDSTLTSTTGRYSPHQHGIASAWTGSVSKMQQRRQNAQTPGSNGVTRVRCFLGGDSILTNKAVPNNAWPTTGQPDGGAWVAAPSSIASAVSGMAGHAVDKAYMFPLSHTYNPNFKGVISVGGTNGKVIVSGIIHGRVTVAATGNIIFGSNVTYYQGNVRDCKDGDIAGFFSGRSVIVSNNTLNAPQTLNNNDSWSTSAGGGFHNFGPVGAYTPGVASKLTIYGFFLTLRTYGAEQFDTGDDTINDCVGNNSGRGCLETFGGIIQGFRGAVTQGTGGGNYTGYKKQYAYDACGATDPPPYYPTTGIFIKNRFYELDPTQFIGGAWITGHQIP